jgi:hypothetical protein
LKTVPVSGGIPRTLCPAPNPVGGCWGANDTIYFVAEEGNSIRSVVADGSGERLLLDRPMPVFAPQLLPEGKGIIATGFFEGKKFNSHDYGQIVYLPLDASGEIRELDSRVILKNGYLASYLSSGHLAFMRGDSLMAVAMDHENLRIDGQPREVVSEVMAPQFSASAGGDLAYIHGKGNWKSSPEWIDREGNKEPLPIEPREFGTFDLSQDNDRLAIQVNDVGSQIFVYDLDTGRRRQLTVVGESSSPVWAPNGRELAFQWVRDGDQAIGYKEVRTSKSPSALLSGPADGYTAPFCFSNDGKELLYITQSEADRTMDIGVLSFDSEKQSRDFLATSSNEWSPALSPDGRWVAFTSDRDGQYQVYVQRYPTSDNDLWTVSDDMGEEPIWSPAGGELFYRSGSRIMVVRYESDSEFSHSKPEVALETRFVNVTGLSYDVSKDGKRFLILKPDFDDTALTEIRIVQNWVNELTHLMPSKATQ